MFVPREAVGQRSETVRRSNLSAIVRAVHLRGQLSRSELVAHTGLTRSAIRGPDRGARGGRAADGDAQRACRCPWAPVAPGPPRHRRRIGGRSRDQRRLARCRSGRARRDDRRARAGRPSPCPRDRSTRSLLTSSSWPSRSSPRSTPRGWSASAWRSPGLCAVGTGSSGSRRTWGGRISPSAIASGWAIRSDAPIAIANEADLGGLAEHRRGAAIGEANVVYVAGEVGIGGHITVGGQPLEGAAGYAGEIGHMVVNPRRRGLCLRLVRLLGDRDWRAGDARPRRTIAKRWSSRCGRAHRRRDCGGAGRLRERRSGRHLAGRGSRVARQHLRPDPGRPGGVLGRIHPLVRPELDAALRRHALSAARELVGVVPGALGVDAPIIGAAELAFEPMLADPARRLASARARRPAQASA